MPISSKLPLKKKHKKTVHKSYSQIKMYFFLTYNIYNFQIFFCMVKYSQNKGFTGWSKGKV